MQIQILKRWSSVQAAVIGLVAILFVAVGCASVVAAEALVVPISPLPGFQASGNATLRAGPGANQFTITVTMTGMSPGPHPEHIHVGRCPNAGAVVYPLPTLQATAAGTASATATINAPLSAVTDGNHSVNVHQSDLTPIACGTIPTQAH